MSIFNLPQVYTCGIIKRDLYNKILKRSNNLFFHSIIPDVYSSVSILLSTSSYLRVKTPLFWVGTSNKSMGRSTRIYSDTTALSGSKSSLPGHHNTFPSRISPCVSYEVHNQALGPYFMLEAISAFPDKKLCGFFSSQFIYNLASSSSLASSLLKSRKSFYHVIKNLFHFYFSKSYSTTPIILLAPLCLLILLLNKIVTFIYRLIIRIARIFKFIRLFATKDRISFPTIDEVNELFIQ